MKIFGYEVREVRKFIAAAVGGAASVASQLLAMGDVLPPQVANWATVVVSVATALGVFGVPNHTPGTITRDEPKSPSESLTEPARVPRKRLPVI
ncbi:hypothetical protein PBI_GAIA_35 [Mycobacterium phage Gaia]|uniref:Holin n=1 Tax=Mycobacterium phage Gaia TaxID=1486472 RepID=A0A068F8M5_9CAUD|nr:membrane protein [Mycobacterium phage Gaia]AID58855.1 hypothetical protein PBI_GAIA_35 [Mycobacterium phage Gaia]